MGQGRGNMVCELFSLPDAPQLRGGTHLGTGRGTRPRVEPGRVRWVGLCVRVHKTMNEQDSLTGGEKGTARVGIWVGHIRNVSEANLKGTDKGTGTLLNDPGSAV